MPRLRRGYRVVEATLTVDGARTRLAIEERGFTLGEVAAHGAGWQAHLEDLAAHMNNRKPGSWRERWHELTTGYDEQARNFG